MKTMQSSICIALYRTTHHSVMGSDGVLSTAVWIHSKYTILILYFIIQL